MPLGMMGAMAEGVSGGLLRGSMYNREMENRDRNFGLREKMADKENLKSYFRTLGIMNSYLGDTGDIKGAQQMMDMSSEKHGFDPFPIKEHIPKKEYKTSLQDGTLITWDVKTGEVKSTQKVGGESGKEWKEIPGPDGSMLQENIKTGERKKVLGRKPADGGKQYSEDTKAISQRMQSILSRYGRSDITITLDMLLKASEDENSQEAQTIKSKYFALKREAEAGNKKAQQDLKDYDKADTLWRDLFQKKFSSGLGAMTEGGGASPQAGSPAVSPQAEPSGPVYDYKDGRLIRTK